MRRCCRPPRSPAAVSSCSISGFDIDDKDPDVEVVDNSFASDAVRLPRFEDSKYSRGVVGLVDRLAALPRCRRAHRQRRRPREHRHGPVSGPGARAEHGARRTAGSRDRQGTCAVLGRGSGVPEASVEGTDGDMQRDTIAALLKHYALGSRMRTRTPTTCRQSWWMPAHSTCCRSVCPGQVVITPHAGEMAKLLNRFETAASTAEHADSHEPYTAETCG